MYCKILQFTDSQSLCAALFGMSKSLDPISKLKELRTTITILWIPGHSNFLGNETTGPIAKQACSENAHLPGVIYLSICTQIRQVVEDPPIQHERTAEVIAPTENTRYEESRFYWQNSVLESTTNYVYTKTS